MLNGTPNCPIRSCLYRIGPLEERFTIMAVNKYNGNPRTRTRTEIMMSNARFIFSSHIGITFCEMTMSGSSCMELNVTRPEIISQLSGIAFMTAFVPCKQVSIFSI